MFHTAHADSCFSFPIVARGVLRWLDIVVGHPDFFLTHDQPTLPPHFALLDEIGTLHPLLRGHVLEVLLNFLGQTYSVDTHQAVALKRKLLDRVLFLFGVGHATQVATVHHLHVLQKYALIEAFI